MDPVIGDNEDIEMHDAHTSTEPDTFLADNTKEPGTVQQTNFELENVILNPKLEEPMADVPQSQLNEVSQSAKADVMSDPHSTSPERFDEEPILSTDSVAKSRDPSVDQTGQATSPTPIPSTIPAPASDTAPDRKPIVNGLAAQTAPNSAVTKVQSRPLSRAGSVISHTNGGEVNSTTKSTGAPSRVYLKEQVNDWLLEGMRWLVYARPENGLMALGSYLRSADEWRNLPGNDKKDTADFQRYWSHYQSWREQNPGKDELEYRASL